MDRQITVIFGVLVSITMILAAIAVLWFGASADLQGIPGLFGPFLRVRSLFAVPVLLTFIGLVGAFSQTSTRIFWTRLDELTPDAQRGLQRYLKTERRIFIGVGIVFTIAQLLVILSMAGLVIPLEFGARTIFFVYGALCACAGNVTPKVPFFNRWWQINRAAYTKVSRFAGWALMGGGVSACLLAVFAPIESLSTSVSIVIGSAVGLMVGNALLHALIAVKKRA